MRSDPPTSASARKLGLLILVALTQGLTTSIAAVTASEVAQDLTGSTGQLLSPSEQTIALVLGGLAALGIAVLGDRWGRRSLLVGTMVLSGVLSVGSAISTDLVSYSVFQLLLRASGLAQLVALVAWAVESGHERRGLWVGLITGAAAAGLPLAALVGGWLSSGPMEWRAVPLLGATQIPLAILVALRMEESEAWARWKMSGAKRTRFMPTMLARGYRVQLLQVGFVLFLSHMAILGALTAWVFHLTEELSLPVGQLTWIFAAAAAGLVGYPIVGKISDRTGRRKAATLSALLGVGALTLMFSSDSQVSRLVTTFLAVLCTGGLNATVQCHGAELFPTDSRMASFAAVRGLFGSIGGVLGPLTAAALAHPDLAIFSRITDAGWAVSMALLPAVLLVWTLPDTSGRPLESIAASVTIPEPEPLPAYPPLSETRIVEDLFRPHEG